MGVNEEERMKHIPVHTQPLQPAVMLERRRKSGSNTSNSSESEWVEGGGRGGAASKFQQRRKGEQPHHRLLYVGQERKKDGIEENRPSAYLAPRNPAEILTFKVGILKRDASPEAVKAGTC